MLRHSAQARGIPYLSVEPIQETFRHRTIPWSAGCQNAKSGDRSFASERWLISVHKGWAAPYLRPIWEFRIQECNDRERYSKLACSPGDDLGVRPLDDV